MDHVFVTFCIASPVIVVLILGFNIDVHIVKAYKKLMTIPAEINKYIDKKFNESKVTSETVRVVSKSGDIEYRQLGGDVKTVCEVNLNEEDVDFFKTEWTGNSMMLHMKNGESYTLTGTHEYVRYMYVTIQTLAVEKGYVYEF